MYKLSLLFADHDSEYVEKVAEFINSEYSSRIKLSSFTKIESLQECLASLKGEVDVLLASPAFLKDISVVHNNINMIIALNDGKISGETKEPAIEKFQPGDKMVSQLLDMYGSKYRKAANLMAGKNETKLIAVYSAAGGTGKTSVALGLCLSLRSRGKEVLFLSFESINSTVSTFTCNGTEALSHIMLCLSENPSMLPVKLELCKTRDRAYDFEFLEPPDCFLELSELQLEDMEKLLNALRLVGKYDYILIDIDSAADSRVLSILTNADKVVFVCGDDVMASYKTDSFLQQIQKIPFVRETGLLSKFMPVMNKGCEYPGNIEKYGLAYCCVIPFLDNLWSCSGGCYSFDSNHFFQESLSPVVESLY